MNSLHGVESRSLQDLERELEARGIHYMELKAAIRYGTENPKYVARNPLHGVERSPSRPPGASLPAANPLHGIESWNPPLSESI